MRKIIWNILVVLAVVNLIWLFVFNYKIPGLPSLSFRKKDMAKSENVEEPLPEEKTAEEIEAVEEEPEAEAEENPDGEETTEAADEEPEVEAEAALAGEEIAEAEAKEPGFEEPETEDDGRRRCHIIDGYNARIRSGPSMDYEIVTEMESGSVLVITGDMEDSWYPVRSEDGAVEGYIYSDLVYFSETEE